MFFCDNYLETYRFRQLSFHGGPFLNLITSLVSQDRFGALEDVLDYHRGVRRTRRSGGGWLRRDQDKLVLQVAGYSGYKRAAEFPTFKLGTVERLLIDVGKIG